MRRADLAERARLNETFAALCRIRSPYGNERECADHVTAMLAGLGFAVLEDDSGPVVGSNAGNLLASIAAADGADTGGVLLCAHLDTVPLTAGVEPVLVDGGWENAEEAILGADNKAAVAVMLELARRCAAEPPPLPVELLFTVCEEDALAGAKAFDAGRLSSRFGYVFDHASPIGEVVVGSPTYFRIEAEFLGRAAHAGIRPQDGRSAIAAAAHAIAAMELGRLDDRTTANVGTVTGGTGINVVAEHCRVELEARSHDEARVQAVVAAMVEQLQEGATARDCDVDVVVSQLFRGYRQRAGAGQVTAAQAALRACGYEPRQILTGGGSDANALEAAGFPCTNLANGTERNHQPDERVSQLALEGMLDVALCLLDEAAAVA